MAPGEPASERDSFGEVMLVGRWRAAIRQLKPSNPEEALRKLLRVATPSLVQTNRAFHQLLHDGGMSNTLGPMAAPSTTRLAGGFLRRAGAVLL